MADPSGPLKPLKILTIDGGGLQAITSLLILDKLLAEIARNNKVPNLKPRPCDVFDTIAGIGAGGWLAILLGRFHMDITACLAEWYKITSCIAPKSTLEKIFMRLLHHCYFDPDCLLEQIDKLTELYETGKYLYGRDTDNIRTRHVFVAALKSDAKGYRLFRSYEIPASAKMPDKLLEGPQNPSNLKISRAFGATGAARYFTPPWKEQMAKSGMMRFRNNKFYRHHNITELALDEMWGIYGKEVPLSIIVNVGPGVADACDIKHIAQRCSWGLDLPQARTTDPQRPKSSISTTTADGIPIAKKISWLSRNGSRDKAGSREHVVRFHDSQVALYSVSAKGDSGQPVNWCGTFGSIKVQTMEQKLKREGRKIVDDIKLKLDNIYGEGSGQNLYHRLAPEKSPQGTALNDSAASRVCLDTAREYASEHSDEISGIARRIAESETPTAAEVTEPPIGCGNWQPLQALPSSPLQVLTPNLTAITSDTTFTSPTSSAATSTTSLSATSHDDLHIDLPRSLELRTYLGPCTFLGFTGAFSRLARQGQSFNGDFPISGLDPFSIDGTKILHWAAESGHDTWVLQQLEGNVAADAKDNRWTNSTAVGGGKWA